MLRGSAKARAHPSVATDNTPERHRIPTLARRLRAVRHPARKKSPSRFWPGVFLELRPPRVSWKSACVNNLLVGWQQLQPTFACAALAALTPPAPSCPILKCSSACWACALVAFTAEWPRMTVWPSGLRRWLQAPVRKGVGSNPTAVTLGHCLLEDALAALIKGPGLEPRKCHMEPRNSIWRWHANGAAEHSNGAARPRQHASASAHGRRICFCQISS